MYLSPVPVRPWTSRCSILPTSYFPFPTTTASPQSQTVGHNKTKTKQNKTRQDKIFQPFGSLSWVYSPSLLSISHDIYLLHYHHSIVRHHRWWCVRPSPPCCCSCCCCSCRCCYCSSSARSSAAAAACRSRGRGRAVRRPLVGPSSRESGPGAIESASGIRTTTILP